MNWLQELIQIESIQNNFTPFLDQYRISDLEKALHLHSSMQQEYICKTKNRHI